MSAGEQAVAPDCGGITVIQGSKSHQPPQQVNLAFGGLVQTMKEHLPRSLAYKDALRAFLADVDAGPKGAKALEAYDDQRAVDSYVVRYWTQYLNESEKRCYNFGVRLAKAQHQAETPWGRQLLAEWERNVDEDVRDALTDGFASLQERLWQKVLACFQSARVVVNRCPRCSRVVRTPRAQQCLWCGHDWHR